MTADTRLAAFGVAPQKNARLKHLFYNEAVERLFKKNEETRLRLIDAAGQVFSEVGYEGATIRQITERAKANVAAINYYFGDKAQLYRAVLKAITHDRIQLLETNCTGGTTEEQLRQFVHTIAGATQLKEYSWASSLMVREIAELHEEQADFIVEAVRPLHAVAEQIVSRFAPEVSSEQVRLAASCIITLCVHLVQQERLDKRMFPGSPLSAEDVEASIAVVYQFALAGIRGVFSPAS